MKILLIGIFIGAFLTTVMYSGYKASEGISTKETRTYVSSSEDEQQHGELRNDYFKEATEYNTYHAYHATNNSIKSTKKQEESVLTNNVFIDFISGVIGQDDEGSK